ncbi:MAG: hypothetical protein JKY37_31695, partial [Nannocystaceae bacterium]|nr:hypothetical protein [Nannocystaceae bacterium]
IGYQRINVTTNGRMCAYPQYAKKLVQSGLTTLLFSIHGADARSHGHQVGVPEAFEQSMAGIEHCRDAAPLGVELGMNVTVTKGNVEALDDIARLAWSQELRWLNISSSRRLVAPPIASRQTPTAPPRSRCNSSTAGAIG